MASVSTSDIPVEQQFMSDFWNFRKLFYNGEDNEDFWHQLIVAANSLSEKYNNEYFNMLILCCVDDIEYRHKQATHSKYMPKDVLKTVYERLKKKDGDSG